MNENNLFNKDIKIRFDNIGSGLYNFQHGFDIILNYLEEHSEVSLKILCLLLILNNYFLEIKDKYNKLEKDLGVLI